MHRLAVSGTYAQFHGEFGTEPIEASTLGKGVLLMGSLLTLGLAWTVRALVAMAAEAGIAEKKISPEGVPSPWHE